MPSPTQPPGPTDEFVSSTRSRPRSAGSPRLSRRGARLQEQPVGRLTPKTTFPQGSFSSSTHCPSSTNSSSTSPSKPPANLGTGWNPLVNTTGNHTKERIPSPPPPARSAFRTTLVTTGGRLSSKYSAFVNSKTVTLEGSAGSVDQLEGSLCVRVPASARRDLDMHAQMMTFTHDERERMTELNVKDRNAAKREVQHDMVHLKTLVAEGIRYQRSNTKTSVFIQKILEASLASVRARAPGSCSLITAEQASDYNFVSRTLHRDIENIYPEYGYGVTVQSIYSLKMWDLN